DVVALESVRRGGGGAGQESRGGRVLDRKDVRERRAAELAESYEREAQLLEKVVRHMKREMELIAAEDYAALCDSLAGRGGHIEEISRLEARRRELEAELSGLPGGLTSESGSPPGPKSAPVPPAALALREALADPRVDEARRKAAAMHRQALELDAQLREMARARRADMEARLAGLVQGRTASHAYNGHGRGKPAPRFLDKER
ncbi:MAG: hypothetical protein ACM3X3_04660, partial [Betaproteobacteria bacterium]